MADDFDPYYEWFGIPPEEQPPHAYRLLGIAVFEANPKVIETAAEQRMLLLRSRQAGKFMVDSQRLLNEVAQAQRLLLDATKRSKYDAQLRTVLASSQVAELPRASEIAEVLPAETEQPLVTSVVVKAKPTSRKQRNPLLMLIASIAVALVAIVGLIVMLNSGASPDVTTVPKSSPPISPSTTNNKATSPSEKAKVATKAVTPEPAKKKLEEPVLSSRKENDTSPVNGSAPTVPAIPELQVDGESSPSHVPAPKRLPMPSDSEIAKKLEEVKRLLARDYAATGKSARQDLLVKLEQLASESREVDLDYLVLLLEARSLATEEGEWRVALRCIDRIAERFDYDYYDAITAVYMKSLNMKREPVEQRDFLGRLVRFAARLIEADRLKPAGKLLKDAESDIAALEERQLTRRAEELRDRGSRLYKEFKLAEESIETLRTSPDDPAANLAAGKYYAFACGRWPRGLVHLSKGDDAELKHLAELDLAKPTDGHAQRELADNWWKYAESLAEPLKTEARLRAGQWYREALASLAGRDLDTVDDRIATLGPAGLAMQGRPQLETGEQASDLVYLDDLQEEVASVYGGAIGRHGNKGTRADWEPKTTGALWNGKRPAHSLYTIPHQEGSALVIYSIQGAFRRFKASVGLSESPPGPKFVPEGRAVFEVFGDGRLLWASPPIGTPGVHKEVDLEIGDVEQLRLQVRVEGNHRHVWATWFEPRLEGCKWPLQPLEERWKRRADEVYLDELTAADSSVGWQHLARFGSSGQTFPLPFRFVKEGEARANHALMMVPKSDGTGGATFQLSKRFNHFSARVGVPAKVNREPHSVSPCKFVLIADGKIRWESKEVSIADQFQECDVRVAGVNELRLETRCSGPNNEAVCCWIAPKLEAASSKPTRRRSTAPQRADRVVVWNSHNSRARDRGTSRFNLLLYLGSELVWQQSGIRLEWDAVNDFQTTIPIPSVSFDRLRLEVTDDANTSGPSLAEIQVLRGQENLALKALITTSNTWRDGNRNERYLDTYLQDGITTSDQWATGYWVGQNHSRPSIDLEWLQAPSGKPHAELGYPLGPHPATAVEFNGHYYYEFAGHHTYAEAQDRCKRMGGYLACVESAAESEFLRGLLGGRTPGPFIGLWKDNQKQWRWVNGDPLQYKNWAPGEPSNSDGGEDRAEFRTDGSWNDVHHERSTRGFICEWEE